MVLIRAGVGRLTRRQFIASGVMLAVSRAAVASSELVVGYLYVGPRDDFGYNQSHARAARAVAALPGVRVVEQERVPESDAVAAAMEAMIVEEGARVLFPTSFGYYDPYVLKLATKYPHVYFCHCGGAWRQGIDPTNVSSYFGHMHEGQHLVGMVAGARADNAQLGFVASNRYPGVMRNLNAFALGMLRTNPQASLRVVFTGSWSDPVREAEAVNVMVDQGISVVGCSVDTARSVVETARRRGIYACGYNASAAELGGDSYLTAAQANWGPHNVDTVRIILAGGEPPNFVSGGLAEGLVDLDAFGPAVDATSVAAVRARRDELVSGVDWIWVGPLVDSDGRERVATGTRIERTDPLLRKMDWFVRGVRA